MRPLAGLAAASLIAIAAACSEDAADAVVDASLQRDLQLASTTSLALAPTAMNLEQPLETAPLAAPTPAPAPRPAPSGTSVARSRRATVAAAPAAQPASRSEAETVLETISQPTESVSDESADAEVTETGDAVALPRPTPVSIEDVGSGNAGSGDAGRSGGWGWGGVVIRGGDIDDCRIEPRGGRAPVRRPGRGVADARWPMGSDRPQTRTGGSDRERSGRGPIASRTGGSTRSGGSSGGRWPGGG